MRVEEERAQIYEALRHTTSEPVRNSFYEQFRITMESKTKKRRVRVIAFIVVHSLCEC